MWHRFSERARRVIFLSQEEAQKYGDAYVSTEHILLGLLDDPGSAGYRAIEHLGVDLSKIRARVETHLPSQEPHVGTGMQLTARAKRVIDLSYEEARQLSNGYIGSEHLFLGLVHEAEGLGGRVLLNMGVTLEAARDAVKVIQTGTPDDPAKQRDLSASNLGNSPSFYLLSAACLAVRHDQSNRDLLAIMLLTQPTAEVTDRLKAFGIAPARLVTMIEKELFKVSTELDDPAPMDEVWSAGSAVAMLRVIATDPTCATHRALVAIGETRESIAAAFGGS